MASNVRRYESSPHLFMMRGLPGSGKTKVARKIMKRYDGTGEVLSTDDYFIDEYGDYHFDFSLLGCAHKWNQERAKEAMQDGVHPIIIDNTNIYLRNMVPYVRMGSAYGYYIMFLTTHDTFRCSVEELQWRANWRGNCGISLRKMYRMKRDFERDDNFLEDLGC